MKKFLLLFLFLAAFLVTAAQVPPTTVLNPSSELAGRTLVLAEVNRTISGTYTFTVPQLFPTGTTGAPGVVSSTDQTTGWQLGLTSIGGSLGGVQRFLLNNTGLAIYGSTIVDNTGLVTTAALGSGTANSSSFLRGDRTWVNPLAADAQEFRLTLTSGTPVTTSDVTAATTLFFSPYTGNRITVQDGSGNKTTLTSSEISIAVPATTNQMYDVWVFNSSGTLTLELLAWTNDTTRATGISRSGGQLTKTGDTTRLYVGSFRTTGVSGQTEDSISNRFVWNYYNRVPRNLRHFETTASWTYSSATIRQADATNVGTANQVNFVVGVSEDPVDGRLNTISTSQDTVYNAGFGLDSTTTFAANQFTTTNNLTTNATGNIIGRFASTAMYLDFPGIGKHTLSWNESAAGTVTIYGTGAGVNAGSVMNMGIVGLLRG